MLLNFDFDGVFIDSFEHWFTCVQRAQAGVGSGRAPDRAALRTTPSFTFDAIGSMLGVPPSEIPHFVQAVYRHSRSTPIPLIAYPGMAETVRRLASRHVLTIVTANLRSQVLSVLRAHGLEEAITLIRDAADPGAKADKISDLRRRFATSRSETFMIGDAISDIRQGKAAGVRTIGAAWGFQPRELLAAEGPDFLADTWQELLEWIQNRWQ